MHYNIFAICEQASQGLSLFLCCTCFSRMCGSFFTILRGSVFLPWHCLPRGICPFLQRMQPSGAGCLRTEGQPLLRCGYMPMTAQQSTASHPFKIRAVLRVQDFPHKKPLSQRERLAAESAGIFHQSRILPSREIVTTCQGRNFPLFFRAVSAAR